MIISDRPSSPVGWGARLQASSALDDPPAVVDRYRAEDVAVAVDLEIVRILEVVGEMLAEGRSGHHEFAELGRIELAEADWGGVGQMSPE